MSKNKTAQIALLGTINASITALMASEKITKSELSSVSRNVLEYLVQNGSTDIDAVNRLLSVLTPMNKRTSVLFFDNFLPWKFDDATESFTSMVQGDKKRQKFIDKVNTFMAEKSNDIWSWAEANVQVEAKPKNYSNLLTSLVTKAMADEQKNESVALTAQEVLKAVMVGGISMAELMEMVDTVTLPDGVEVPGELVAGAAEEEFVTH